MLYILANAEYDFFSTLEHNIDLYNMGVGDKALELASLGKNIFYMQKNPALSPDGVPAYELKSTKTDRVLFSLRSVDENDTGLLVDIEDNIGLLGSLNRYPNTVFESKSAAVSDAGLRGPYPVLDAEVIGDYLEERLFSKENLRLSGNEKYLSFDAYSSYLRYADEPSHVSVKDVNKELSRRNSPALGNYSYLDILSVAHNPNMELMDFTGKSNVQVVCDLLEVEVKKRGECLSNNKFMFVSDEMKANHQEEQIVLIKSDMLRGLNPFSGGKLLGEADGYKVVIKFVDPAKDPFGRTRKVDYLRNGSSISFLKACKIHPEMKDIMFKALSKAERRSKNIERFDRFKQSIGISRKKVLGV